MPVIAFILSSENGRMLKQWAINSRLPTSMILTMPHIFLSVEFSIFLKNLLHVSLASSRAKSLPAKTSRMFETSTISMRTNSAVELSASFESA